MSVAELAREARLESDEALLRLWDGGIDEPTRVTDEVPRHLIDTARQALGLPRASQLKLASYWQARLGLSEKEFESALERVGIRFNPNARTLPKGAVKKLRQLEDPSTSLATASTPRPQKAPEFDTLVWETVGRVKDVRHLTAEEVEGIHFLLVKDFQGSDDPISPPGVRDRGILESAVFRTQTANGDVRKYPSVEMAGAALLHSLVNDHPFHNGNKRAGLVSMAVLLYENGMRLTCSEDALFKIVLQTAQRRLVPEGSSQRDDREVLVLANWIQSRSAAIVRGEKLIKWHQLKKLLAKFDVTFDHHSGVGNRINLHRTVTRKGLVRSDPMQLHTQVNYQNDGAEVARNTVAKIRADLHLDEASGIDSSVFYEGLDASELFITQYQRTLRRLARM